MNLLQHSELTDFPVVDDDGELQGVVSFQDIRSVMVENELYSLLIAADIIGGEPPAVEAGASLTEALAVFAENDVYNLPVVADSEHRRLVGVITRSRLMSHYHQELQMRTETASQF